MGKMDGNINHFIIGKMDGTIYHLMETKIRKISHWMGKIEEHQPCKSDVIEGGLPCHEASISWVCLKIRCPSLDPLVPPEIPVKAVKVLATPLQWHSLLWSTGLKWPSVFSCFFEAKNMRIWWEYRYGPITWDWTTRAIRVFIPFSNIEPIHFGVSWFWLCLSAPWRCNLTFSVNHTPKWFASRDVLSATSDSHGLSVYILKNHHFAHQNDRPFRFYGLPCATHPPVDRARAN